MTMMKRRTFLRGAGGTAVAAIGVLYPGAAEAVTRRISSSRSNLVPEPIGLDPTYAGGEVVAKTSEGFVVRTPETSRAVRVPDGTVVWKEFEGTVDLIQLHDWVDAKGDPQKDGTLLARSGMVFVNIGRRDGMIEEISPAGIRLLRADNAGHWHITFSRTLEVIRGDDGERLALGLAGLRVGQNIGAVGLLLPTNGFRATRIWT